MHRKFLLAIILFVTPVVFLSINQQAYSGGGFSNIDNEELSFVTIEPATKNELVPATRESVESNKFVVGKNFVSDVLALETALFAFLIPLSFDIVARFSDKYKSRVISKQFISEPDFIRLLYLLFANILFLIVLSFFDVKNTIIVFLAGMSALITIFFLFKFLQLLFSYTTDTRYLRNKFQSNAQKHIK